MSNLERHGEARALLRSLKAGVLSTRSVEVEGYPFGSVVPYCLDRQGRPTILISSIAQHSRNLGADPRACLTVLAGGADVQASARLSVLVKAERVAEDGDDVAERYARHFPASRDYHRTHDFFYVRLEPVRFRWIGGFGDIRWIAPQELLVPSPFSREQETAIVEHMNDDHADTMRGYLRRLAGVAVGDDDAVTMAGVDAEGIDLLAAGRLVRLAFPRPVSSPGEARARLVEMARGG